MIRIGAYRCPRCKGSLALEAPPAESSGHVLQVPRPPEEIPFLSHGLLRLVRGSAVVLWGTALTMLGGILWAAKTELPTGGSHPDAGLGLLYGFLILGVVFVIAIVHAVAGGVAWRARSAVLLLPGFLCLLDAAGVVAWAARGHSALWTTFLLALAGLSASSGTILLWAAVVRGWEALGQAIAAGAGLATLLIAFGCGVGLHSLIRMPEASTPPTEREAKAKVEYLARQAEEFRLKNGRFPESHKELMAFTPIPESHVLARYRKPGPHKCLFAIEAGHGGSTYSIDSPECRQSREGDEFWSELYRVQMYRASRFVVSQVERHPPLQPGTSEAIQGLGTDKSLDPWGRPFLLKCPGPDGCKWAVGSLGADGRAGGESADTDFWLHEPRCGASRRGSRNP